MGVNIKLSDLEEDVGDMRVQPTWRRTPCRAPRASKKSREALFDAIDGYFSDHFDEGTRPTLCDMAGQAGFDSVTQMMNHARRNGGEMMRGVSRGVLVVAANYEELAQEGNRNAMQLLGLMPQFDSAEPAAQKPQRPFLPQAEINLNISGVHHSTEQGAQLSEQEAYLKVIKHKTYEEIAARVLEAKPTEDGDFAVIELEAGDE